MFHICGEFEVKLYNLKSRPIPFWVEDRHLGFFFFFPLKNLLYLYMYQFLFTYMFMFLFCENLLEIFR